MKTPILTEDIKRGRSFIHESGKTYQVECEPYEAANGEILFKAFLIRDGKPFGPTWYIPVNRIQNWI